MACPRGCQHVIDILFLTSVAHVIDTALVAAFPIQQTTVRSILLGLSTALGTPELGDSAQLVLKHLIVLINQCTHVGLKTTGCVD